MSSSDDFKTFLVRATTSRAITLSILLVSTIAVSLIEYATRASLTAKVIATVLGSIMWFVYTALSLFLLYLIFNGKDRATVRERVGVWVVVDHKLGFGLTWTTIGWWFWMWQTDSITNTADIASAWDAWLHALYMGTLYDMGVGFGQYVPSDLYAEGLFLLPRSVFLLFNTIGTWAIVLALSIGRNLSREHQTQYVPAAISAPLTAILSSRLLTVGALLWSGVWVTIAELVGRESDVVRVLAIVGMVVQLLLWVFVFAQFMIVIYDHRPQNDSVLKWGVVVDMFFSATVVWVGVSWLLWLWEIPDEATPDVPCYWEGFVDVTSAWDAWFRHLIIGVWLDQTVGYGRYVPVRYLPEFIVMLRVQIVISFLLGMGIGFIVELVYANVFGSDADADALRLKTKKKAAWSKM